MVARIRLATRLTLVGFGLESGRRRFTQLPIAFIRGTHSPLTPPHAGVRQTNCRARCGCEIRQRRVAQLNLQEGRVLARPRRN